MYHSWIASTISGLAMTGGRGSAQTINFNLSKLDAYGDNIVRSGDSVYSGSLRHIETALELWITCIKINLEI